MRDKNFWMKRSLELLKTSYRTRDQFMNKQKNVKWAEIISAMFLKSVHTFEAIRFLYANGLSEQGQVLIRALFELRLDLYEFIRLCTIDPEIATRRLIDAMMLEKPKQQRATKSRGFDRVKGAPTPEAWSNIEKDIFSRYNERELKRLKRFGFSGMSIEVRANKSGLNDVYNLIYRNFSRNVHSTDYAEYPRKQPFVSGKTDAAADYEDLRDHVAMSAAITSMWQICVHAGAIAFGNKYISSGVGVELRRISRKCEQMAHWVEEAPIEEDGGGPHGERE